jgi:two-component system chemotaxis response regulator CheY
MIMSKRVLIVDDSPMIHHILRKTLESNGYEVCGDAKNGREGIELFEKLAPDLVFMDVTMPILDGIESLKGIMEKNSAAKVIMLTAMGDEEIIAQAEAAGAAAFLKKPFNDFKIISAISKIV